MNEMESILKHHGVKGMKWGVIRDRSKTTIRDHLNSLSRERSWKKILKEVDNLSTKQIHEVSKRVNLENDLKRLSRDKTIATKKDKTDYLRREGLTDEELSVKVTRLRAKESLSKAVNNASKEQREFGEKVVNIGGALSLKYATTKSIKPKDVFDAVNDPKKMKDAEMKKLTDKMVNK